MPLSESNLSYILLIGLALLAVAYLWLVAAAFRTYWAWGLAGLFPPMMLVFLFLHPGRAWKPALLMAVAVALVAFPPLFTRFVPVDLGPRDKMVDGERHLTLTGWDRTSYDWLRSRPDAVVLQIANPDVDDATLDHLAGMTLLRELDLNGTKVTDAGLARIASLPSLEIVRLKGTRITDEGFRDSLANLGALRMIDLTGTGVSRETVAAWKKEKPRRRALQ